MDLHFWLETMMAGQGQADHGGPRVSLARFAYSSDQSESPYGHGVCRGGRRTEDHRQGRGNGQWLSVLKRRGFG